jgi:hypothetical protein
LGGRTALAHQNHPPTRLRPALTYKSSCRSATISWMAVWKPLLLSR